MADGKPKTEFEQAAQDVADIVVLNRSEAFNRYYLRRLKEKIQKLQKSILEERNIDAEELQKKRHTLWALEELKAMPEIDRKLCEKMTEGKGDPV